jgi:hypothetical protein
MLDNLRGSLRMGRSLTGRALDLNSGWRGFKPRPVGRRPSSS